MHALPQIKIGCDLAYTAIAPFINDEGAVHIESQTIVHLGVETIGVSVQIERARPADGKMIIRQIGGWCAVAPGKVEVWIIPHQDRRTG